MGKSSRRFLEVRINENFAFPSVVISSYLVWNSTCNRVSTKFSNETFNKESQQKRNMTVVNNRLDTKLDLSGSHARYNKFSPFSCSSSLFVQQLLLRLIERSLVLGHGPLPRGIRVLYLTNEPAYYEMIAWIKTPPHGIWVQKLLLLY